MHQNLHFLRRIVFYFADFYLASVAGFQDAFYQRRSSATIGYFLNHKRFLVDLPYLGTDPNLSAMQAVVIVRYIDTATCGKIGIQLKIRPTQHFYRGIDKFVEIMRQHLASQTESDTFHALEKQQRKLDGERHRFLIPAIVRRLPLRGLGIERHIEGEF